MGTFSNNTGVPLSVAVYLATDHYDYIPNTVSATALLKPTKQYIMGKKRPAESVNTTPDILSMAKSRVGTSIHDGVEKAWSDGRHREAMASLGYPQDIIDRVIVNPTPEDLKPDSIPVYMELRSFKEIDGVRVSGKFDFVAEGKVEDFKSTSTFAWKSGDKVEDYRLQGSIYRWLNPDIITRDVMAIQFFFTDWMPGKAKQDPTYPQRYTEKLDIALLSLEDTEQYIKTKLALFERYKDADEADIPVCTPKELWQKSSQFKYYKNPKKMTRSTKNYNSLIEAQAHMVKDGSQGVVIEKVGEVIACRFCQGRFMCKQKDAYLAAGTLQLND
jgi:hypothetical protein|tara:strand:+ start:303 stop:1292 length:990 start_codon:yes stop_codon:yes gene_type:complete